MIIVQRNLLEYPINDAYPAVYRDKHGEENTVIHNDGLWLRMTVRGVEFESQMLDDFEPLDSTNLEAISTFVLQRGTELCDCEIEFDMPMPMADREAEEATLHVHMRLGAPTERGGLSQEEFTLTLHHAGNRYSATEGWVEDALLKIQALLPKGTFMKACINCAFSDFGAGGHGAFGCLYCFRNNKIEYQQVDSRASMYHLLNNVGATEVVQETYLCPKFARRKPGTGYRG